MSTYRKGNTKFRNYNEEPTLKEGLSEAVVEWLTILHFVFLNSSIWNTLKSSYQSFI